MASHYDIILKPIITEKSMNQMPTENTLLRSILKLIKQKSKKL